MEKFVFDFKMLVIVGFLCFGLFLSSENSFAQTSTATTPNAFKFKLVAFDGQGKGVITQATTSILFAIQVINETSNIYSGSMILPSSLVVYNYPTTIGVGGTPGGTLTPVEDSYTAPFWGNHTPYDQRQIQPFSSEYFYILLPNIPLALNKVSTNSAIIAAVSFKYITSSGYNVSTSLQDVIYTPSNTDLIPIVVNNQTTASSMLSAINSTENVILKDVAPPAPPAPPQCKAITFALPGGPAEICGDNPSAVNPQVICAAYGYSGGTERSIGFADGPYSNRYHIDIPISPTGGNLTYTNNGHTAAWSYTPGCNSWAQITCNQCS